MSMGSVADPVDGLAERVLAIEAAATYDQAVVGRIINELTSLEAVERRSGRTTIRIDALRLRAVKVMNAGRSAIIEADRETAAIALRNKRSREESATRRRETDADEEEEGDESAPQRGRRGRGGEPEGREGSELGVDDGCGDASSGASNGLDAERARAMRRAAAAGFSRRTKSKTLKKDERAKAVECFDRILSKYGWADGLKVDVVLDLASGTTTQVTRADKYVKNGQVHCNACETGIDCTEPTNATAHANGARHKARWALHAQDALGKLLVVVDKPVPLARDDKVQHAHLMDDVRAFAAARAVGGGTNPEQLSALFGSDSTVVKALAMCKTHGVTFGARSTIDRDLIAADKALCTRLAELIKGTTGALVVDGASFNHLHAVGVSYDTPFLPAPIFLGLIFAKPTLNDKNELTYDHEDCANDVSALAKDIGLDLQLQVTELMGDNVAYNKAVARRLGVDLGKCIPHALALTVKKALFLLPFFRDTVVYGSTLLYSGGTDKRATALAELGLCAQKLRVVSTRFGSAIDPAAYRLANFEKLKTWHTSSPLLPLVDKPAPLKSKVGAAGAAGAGAGAAGEGAGAAPALPADSDDELNDVAILHGGYAKKCATAHENTRTPVALAIVGAMYTVVPRLIAVLSADGDHVPSNAIQELLAYKQHLSDAASDPAMIVLEATVAALGESVSPAKQAQMNAAFVDAVKKMAVTGLEAFENHITPSMKKLQMRATYDINVSSDVPDLCDISKEDIGCPLSKYTMSMKREFLEYKKEVSALHAADALLPPVISLEARKLLSPAARVEAVAGRIGYLAPSVYWRGKLNKWRLLAPVALWYLGFPTSSIAMERVFARMRMMGTPQRMSADEATFSRELRFRANQAVIDNMLSEKMTEARSVYMG